MINNSDLEKWQKAIHGIETGQKDLSEEELSAFQTLKELSNNDNFESNESGKNIGIIDTALQSHNNNRLLKAHLQSFVNLCKAYFKSEAAAEVAQQIKPQAVATKKTLHTVKEPQVSRKKSRKWIKWMIPIAVIIIAGVAAMFFSDKITSLFGKGGGETVLLYPVSSNGEKWGYINHKGEYVINPQFDDADFFSDGLAKVKSNGKIGYINKKGEYVVPAIYKEGTEFSDGLAFVVEEGGRPICIDKNGNTKFTLNQAERVWAYKEGLALFENHDGKYGFYDKSRHAVINAQFDYARPFSEGFAAVIQDGKWGFIDKTGIIKINPQFERVGDFSEGKAAFYDGNQWGYINTNGLYAINPQFEAAYPFSMGMAVAGQKQGDVYKWGFINKDGRLVINSQYDRASSFSEGLAAVAQGDKYGYINKEGQVLVNPQFEYASDFYNGIAPVRSNNKWGFINTMGQYVINPQFIAIKVKNVEISFVQNNYYNAPLFIEQFFKRCAGNSFDGINASTTLEKLANHSIYGACLDDRDEYRAVCHKDIGITKDISIVNVQFVFDEPIYGNVATYNDWGYQTGTRKEYNFSVKTVAMRYYFSFTGKAERKGSAVAMALKNEIERRYQKKMEYRDGEHGGKKCYYLLNGDDKLNFAIEYYDYEIGFIVAFREDALQKIF